MYLSLDMVYHVSPNPSWIVRHRHFLARGKAVGNRDNLNCHCCYSADNLQYRVRCWHPECRDEQKDSGAVFSI